MSLLTIHLDQDARPSINNWITQFTPGRSFADLGGLWGTVNERISVAMSAGASSATMVDVTPMGTDLWFAFEKRLATKGISGYREKVVDLTAHDAPALAGRYQMANCCGVIYHLPDPLQLLRNLRSIATERLIIGSMVVPEVIKNDVGSLDLRGGRALYVPGLTGDAKLILARHFDQLGLQIHGINADMHMPWMMDGQFNYAPWWWLFTPQLLCSMVESVGLKVIGQAEEWEDRAIALFCETR